MSGADEDACCPLGCDVQVMPCLSSGQCLHDWWLSFSPLETHVRLHLSFVFSFERLVVLFCWLSVWHMQGESVFLHLVASGIEIFGSWA